MAHLHYITDEGGDTVDLAYFCGDYCHRSWCDTTHTPYEGWNGCHEIYTPTHCQHCGEGLTYWNQDTQQTEATPVRA